MINKERFEQASSYFNSKLNFMEILEDFGLLDGSITTADGVNIICPFHDDKDPSLKVDTNRNVYKCFGCGANGGGNAIKFIARYRTDVLGNKIAYSRVLENLLKNDMQARAELGFSTIFDSAPSLDELLVSPKPRKIKLKKESVTSFMDLSRYLINNCSNEEKLKAVKLMQDGFDAESIFNLMFNKSKFSKSLNSVRNDFENLLGSD